MPKVKVIDKGCRGCTLCVDICPVDVFDFDEEKEIATVSISEDCIGCLSCAYICPSQCIEVSNVQLIRPFHRIEQNVSLVEQFLQVNSIVNDLTDEELDTANSEVGILLSAFAQAITEILGRGHKSVGRRAGTLAAAHLPEMYEKKAIDIFLKQMHKRYAAGFNFNYSVFDDAIIVFHFQPCTLVQAVKNAGTIPGRSDLCLIFHEYWAGLISVFTGTMYSYEVLYADNVCKLKFFPRKRL
jgi:NAD-dependent dihydropyrimidine dehydrogenase PreA subunit